MLAGTAATDKPLPTAKAESMGTTASSTSCRVLGLGAGQRLWLEEVGPSQGPKDANPLGLFDSKRRREYGGQQARGTEALEVAWGFGWRLRGGCCRWCEASARRSS